MPARSRDDARPLSARVCGILSVAIAIGALLMIDQIASRGGQWAFSVLFAFVPILFAVQGLRLSREPDQPWRIAARVLSIAGIVLGAAAAVGFAILLTRSV